MTRIVWQLQRSMLIFLLAIAFQLKADSWSDPKWKEMLDHSEVIALIRYTSSGDFRAGAKILTIYKGILKPGDEIWISGFSNRYGPIDKVGKGDTYIVFLNALKVTEDRTTYWNGELKKDKRIIGFVNAYKQGKAYYVTTPTSGDLRVRKGKVQYDLLQTTYYRNQEYYPLGAFEQFLIAYNDKTKVPQLCTQLLVEIKPATADNSKAQGLQQLALLGYQTYDPVFEDYLMMPNASSRYALAQLAGNIRSAESRNILIKLLEDPNGIIQGEAVRQLKGEPVEIVAPILLANLKKSSDTNFGPSNVMDPVVNRINGGQLEIINALGEFKYQAAIPDLLSLLETNNEQLFTSVILALKKMESREYTKYINNHLDKKTDDLIFEISMMIAKDSLVECLPSFKNFISTCNRNANINYEYTLSTCCGVAHFKDSSTISFILSDYDRFISNKDTLTSRNVELWTRQYIETFTELKVKEARPLIYASLYDWFGVNEDFVTFPRLYRIKKDLEDSLSMVVNHKLGKGYRVDACIAFIENSGAVIKGDKPKVRYMIQVTVPSTKEGEKHRELFARELNLPIDNIYVKFSDDVYYLNIQYRFDKNIRSTPLYYFLDYAVELPNPQDVEFFQSMIDNHFLEDVDDVSKAIGKIKSNLH